MRLFISSDVTPTPIRGEKDLFLSVKIENILCHCFIRSPLHLHCERGAKYSSQIGQRFEHSYY